MFETINQIGNKLNKKSTGLEKVYGLYLEAIELLIAGNSENSQKFLLSCVSVSQLPQASFQNNASRSSFDWLIREIRRFDWLRIILKTLLSYQH